MQKSSKALGFTVAAIICIAALSLISPALSKKPDRIVNKLNDETVTDTAGIEVYWDSKGTSRVSSIEWGPLEPGAEKELTMFVKNKGKTQVVLSYFVSNWNDPELANFLHLTWDYTGQSLKFKEIIQVVFTLQASEDAEATDNFSFDITILSNL